MTLFVPTFQLFSADDDAVRWRMLGPTGREVARGASADASVDEARASVAHVVDTIDLFHPSLRRTAAFRWRWVLTFDTVPVVWGSGEHGSAGRCEQACRRFTLLAPLADLDAGAAIDASRRVAVRS